jgi:hypothetical protein
VFASLTTRRPSATRSWLTRSGVAFSIWSYPKVGSETFRGPSWAGTLRVACPQGEPRTARGNANSSGASSGGPTWAEALLIAIRWRSVLLSPAAPFFPLPAFRGGGDFRPDHELNLPSFSESGKRKIRVIACG